jgi:hypothetical protein
MAVKLVERAETANRMAAMASGTRSRLDLYVKKYILGK